MVARISRPFLALGAPLSRVLIPLLLGLTRRMLLRLGVASLQRRLAGITIHYYALGGKPGSDPRTPIVLVHGIADSALTWAFVIGRLARVGPVYALDLPGFGLSGTPPGRPFATINEQTDVLAAFISEVVGRPAIVVGNSMGGWNAAKLALERPELVAGIVLLDPGGALLDGRSSWDSFVATVAVNDLRAVRRIYRQMFADVIPLLYVAQLSFQELFARASVREFVAHSVSAAERDDLDAAGFLSAAELRRIAVPTVLVWGAQDTFLPDGSFAFFRDNLPGARVYVLDGCGHLPQREAPRAVARIVAEFAERVRLLIREPV